MSESMVTIPLAEYLELTDIKKRVAGGRKVFVKNDNYPSTTIIGLDEGGLADIIFTKINERAKIQEEIHCLRVENYNLKNPKK